MERWWKLPKYGQDQSQPLKWRGIKPAEHGQKSVLPLAPALRQHLRRITWTRLDIAKRITRNLQQQHTKGIIKRINHFRQPAVDYNLEHNGLTIFANKLWITIWLWNTFVHSAGRKFQLWGYYKTFGRGGDLPQDWKLSAGRKRPANVSIKSSPSQIQPSNITNLSSWFDLLFTRFRC